MACRSDFQVVSTTPDCVTIRDLDLGRMSVTNDAEAVVAHLRKCGILRDGKRLLYYDSQGDLDEIVWRTDGSVSFAPGC